MPGLRSALFRFQRCEFFSKKCHRPAAVRYMRDWEGGSKWAAGSGTGYRFFTWMHDTDTEMNFVASSREECARSCYVPWIVGEHPHVKGVNIDHPLVIAEAPKYTGVEQGAEKMFKRSKET